jgi:2-polyprenyl-3-methyl-5-hydroxy-6-metoxy-1,4-benzoquinol methylase
MRCPVCEHESDPDDAAFLTKDGFDLVRCPACGLVSRRVLPDRAELAELYADEYFRDAAGTTGGYADYLADEPLHRSLARRRLQRLETLSYGGRALLDVGAAAGFFVSEAVKRGWDARGVDVSPVMVEYATSRLGVSIACGEIGDVGDGPFDVVTMWDYIEHAIDPAKDIATVAQLLPPGGMIALSTGDIDSLAARVSGSRWHLLTPRHHNFFFSARTLTRLLETRGFEVEDVRHPGARYSMSHAFYKLGSALPGRASARITRRIGDSRIGAWGVPINLFDIVTIVARRVSR